MKVKLIGFSMVMLLACAGVSLVYANQCHSEHSGMKEGLSYDKALLDTIEVGNKICPVSGEDIESMGVGIEYEYNGKIYNFCCSMCI
ncbi:MAG: hypothetical protein KKD55_00850, partial [Candidatus Omnitrophica bacterium]|nr:hypothetical protein [Candidatus Omnitrophota bacterium]